MAEIQIEQNLPAEEKTQKIERISWFLLAIFLVLAFLGLFGKGPISRINQSTDDNKLRIENERFERYNSSTDLIINIGSEATASTTEIGIENKLLESIQIENLTPTAQFSRAEGNKTFFTFQTTEKQEAKIAINARTKKIGQAKGEISLTNGPSLRVSQFIYP